MEILAKLYRHIERGTLIRRVIDYQKIKNEQDWRAFFGDDSRNTICKKLPKGGKIVLDKHNLISKAIYLDKFETFETNYVAQTLNKGDIFIDVGANIGLFTIIASNKIGSNGRVYAFEPTSETYGKLIKNIKINQSKNVVCKNVAVSNREGKAYISINGSENSALNSIVSSSGNTAICEEIQCIALDEFFQENKISGIIKLIKIDVEGWELPVLQGMLQELKVAKPELIIEVNENNYRNVGYEVEDILNLLEQSNYNIYEFDDQGELIPFSRKEYYSYSNIVAKK